MRNRVRDMKVTFGFFAQTVAEAKFPLTSNWTLNTKICRPGLVTFRRKNAVFAS